MVCKISCYTVASLHWLTNTELQRYPSLVWKKFVFTCTYLATTSPCITLGSTFKIKQNFKVWYSYERVLKEFSENTKIMCVQQNTRELCPNFMNIQTPKDVLRKCLLSIRCFSCLTPLLVLHIFLQMHLHNTHTLN